MTLSYELCKRLKACGFPQSLKKGDLCYNDETEWLWQLETGYSGGETVKKPSLSELIEACGKIMLLEVEGEWFACTPMDEEFSFSFSETSYSQIDTLTDFSAKGKTPEKAAANLFIKLKESENTQKK